MDWSRAKTILIWAFLLLDLFLAYQVSASRTEKWMDTEAVVSDKWDIELYLKQQNIELQAEVPKETPEMTYLNVKYLGLSALTLQDMLGIKVTQEKSAIFAQLVPPIELREQTSSEELLRQMRDRLPHAGQYQMDSYQTVGNRLLYWQMHEKRPLFVAPLEIFVGDGAVRSYRQTYFNIRSQGSGRQVISAYTALRSLVDKDVIGPGQKIVNVTLGYYGYHYDADIQVLAPVWRFIDGAGGSHYINAFTGAVERPLDTNKIKQ